MRLSRSGSSISVLVDVSAEPILQLELVMSLFWFILGLWRRVRPDIEALETIFRILPSLHRALIVGLLGPFLGFLV